MSVAFVNGCFDLLAPHHVRFLECAAQYADSLVVGLNSDDSVRRLKGPARPFYSQVDRKKMLEAIRWVDWVEVFDTEEELSAIIESRRPDVLVKGIEYKGRPVTGAEFSERIVFVDTRPRGGITEDVIRRIKDS